MLILAIGLVSFCFVTPAQARFNFITPGHTSDQERQNFVVPASTSLLQRHTLLPGIVQPSSEQPKNHLIYNIATYNLGNLPNLDLSKARIPTNLNQHIHPIFEEPSPEKDTKYGSLNLEKLPTAHENKDSPRFSSDSILRPNGEQIKPLFFFPRENKERFVPVANTVALDNVVKRLPKFKVYQAVPSNA